MMRSHMGLLVNRSTKLPIHTLLFFLGVRGLGGPGGGSKKGAEGVDQGCPEGAQGVHEGCKGILGFCMRNATGCAKGAVRTADTLALQDQFDHSCVTEGHLQHELDAKLAQAMAPSCWLEEYLIPFRTVKAACSAAISERKVPSSAKADSISIGDAGESESRLRDVHECKAEG
ncbi:MAG: hypothetical protein FRX49_13702 [Trebouxia sp. A1-2]|nr:MAG: hypothetical protein FRX49_13702 [Trebouxia sp. A1-2]